RGQAPDLGAVAGPQGAGRAEGGGRAVRDRLRRRPPHVPPVRVGRRPPQRRGVGRQVGDGADPLRGDGVRRVPPVPPPDRPGGQPVRPHVLDVPTPRLLVTHARFAQFAPLLAPSTGPTRRPT